MATQRHYIAAIALALACGLAAAGCTPSAEPTPTATATGFRSDDEAFAAAEATYRAYVDATNARRSDPNSHPDPTDFLTGEALDDEIATDQTLLQRGWKILGDTALMSVKRLSVDSTGISLEACLDSRGTRVVDGSDADVTPRDRVTVQSLDLKFVSTATGLLVSESKTGSGSC